MKDEKLKGKKMKRLVIYIVATMLAVGSQAQVTCQQQDSVKICSILEKSNRQTTTLWLARQFMDVPYVAHTLEVNDHEQLVINTRQLDCTTLVETVTALKMCAQQGRKTFADYQKALLQLRYRDGRLTDYTSRLHYFSDWIENKGKMGLTEELQQPNPPFTAVQKLHINYMSQHPQSYKALKAQPSLVPVIRKQEQELTGRTYRYIPKTAVQNTKLLRQTIHDGDIIAITCNKPGLDIAHLGFAVWRKDGLHLLNASMLHKKVVEEPMTLYRYLQKHPSFTGIRIVKIKD